MGPTLIRRRTIVVGMGFLLVAAAASHTRESASVRIVTFNIRFDNPRDGVNAWPRRRSWVADILDSTRADVIGLQEALIGQVRDLERALPGYARVGVGRDDGKKGGEFSPLFYRRDRFEALDWGTLWLSSTPTDTGSVGWDAALPRIATWLVLRPVGDGNPVLFVNTHFDHVGRLARFRSAELLRRRFSPERTGMPVVLMGDLNVVDSTATYRALTTGPGALVDTWRAVGEPGPVGTYTGFESDADPSRRIDYVFVSASVEPVDTHALALRRNGRVPSDHRPVVADVRMR